MIDNPVCPHCQTEIENWWECVDLDDGANTEITCDGCGRVYWVQTVVNYSFKSAVDEDEL